MQKIFYSLITVSFQISYEMRFLEVTTIYGLSETRSDKNL